jgi:hypothetical protein
VRALRLNTSRLRSSGMCHLRRSALGAGFETEAGPDFRT